MSPNFYNTEDEITELCEAVDGCGSADVEEGDLHVAHEVVVAQVLDLLDGQVFLRHDSQHIFTRINCAVNSL